jgi:[acyl-carrier-protein] S-malonyltransferase
MMTRSATTVAFMFPGQGSQSVGMGRDIRDEWPALAGPYYREADDILGFPLSRLCWEGTAEALGDTSATQPAIFVTSVVALEVLRRHGVIPGVVAGHSLGEYAALVCAGVLAWTDALRLVQLRGNLMASVNDRVPGAMAAVMGLDVESVERVCARAAADTGQLVEVANDNGPAQVVVSGQAEAVALAVRQAPAAGALRAVPLKVGAPFHCGLMREIEAEFTRALAQVSFLDPAVPVVSSVSGEPVTTARQAVDLLGRQLTGRVRWTETVRRMTESGADYLIEVGPGRVLCGLCRRIVPDARIASTNDRERLADVLAAVATR